MPRTMIGRVARPFRIFDEAVNTVKTLKKRPPKEKNPGSEPSRKRIASTMARFSAQRFCFQTKTAVTMVSAITRRLNAMVI